MPTTKPLLAASLALLLALTPTALSAPGGTDEDRPGPNPLATGDDGLLPFPSLHFTRTDPDSATGLRLAYHREMLRGPDGSLPLDPSICNIADGVSPVTPILVSFGADVHPDFLSPSGEQAETVRSGAPIALIHAETGAAIPILTEMDQNNRERAEYAGRHPLCIRPLAPMEMGARYLVLLTRDLRDSEGAALPAQGAFDALRDGGESGKPAVEALRERYEELFAVAERAGWKREELLLAWEFQVASERFLLGPIRDVRAQTLAAAADEGVPYTIDEVLESPNENVAWLIKGTFQPASFLDARNELKRVSDEVVERSEESPSYPFTMLIPPAARKRGGLPLVLFGHGLFGTGQRYLTRRIGRELVQPLSAEHDAVIIATDWIGLSGGDLTLILTQVVPNISRIRLVTDRLVQSHANNLALVELALGKLQSDPAIGRKQRRPLLDPKAIYYYGISLGGIQGASQVAISPRISRAVLAVPGAGWAHMIQRSTQFSPIERVIDERYPDPLTQNFFTAILQTFFDFSDPANLAPLMVADPSQPRSPSKVVILQEAIGDCQVPNMATDLLARAIGAAHLEVAPDPVFGLRTINGPTKAAVLTQFRVPHLLEEYTPPDENTIPKRDNGVHNAAVLQDVAFAQLGDLLETGRASHPCEGNCDPD
ncbi:MAG: hypothetical protein CMJ84_03210 [Planctomycetes bacterium]|jgi:hypothetical protein|nr:hypothetical protein [Planctomycetota bacterium]MDP6410739.1 hypothetical protein [Planctomycetota bacterium]